MSGKGYAGLKVWNVEGSGKHLSEHLVEVVSCRAEEGRGGVTEAVLTRRLLWPWGKKRQGRVWWTDCRILLLSRSCDTVSTLTSISLGSNVRSFWIKIIFERLVSSYKTFPWINTWCKKGKVWEPRGTVTPLPYVLPFIFLRL